MLTTEELKQELVSHIFNRLGGGMVDVELDPEHYDTAIKRALSKYRQRAENSVEESYAILELIPEQQNYTLPDEVMSVKQIFRRGLGNSQATSNFEPFSAGWMNAYLLQSGRQGGMVMYELYAGFQELAMRMFGGYLNFSFNPVTKQLTLMRKIPIGAEENVLLWQYNYKPDQVILSDHRSGQWIQDYSYAQSKHMLGLAYDKFQTINGPQGGTSLNGSTLITEAKEEMKQLEEDLKNFEDGSNPMWFIRG
jgi:hypothetical protein